MEEEGSSVFYEGSPGALEVRGDAAEELVVKREDYAFPTPSDPTTAPVQTQGPWGYAGGLEWYLDTLRRYSPGGMVPWWTMQERAHLGEVVTEITNSPLLSDEDHQLLTAATSRLYPNPATDLPTLVHTRTPSSWLWTLALSLPVVVAMGYWFHPLSLIVGVALPLLLALPYLASRWYTKIFTRAQSMRLEYYNSMDKLLTQLTATIRWLQEVEIVSRGLTRPLSSLPASRLDRGHTHKLLRGRVLRTCGKIVVHLRACTRKLCSSCDLVPELDDGGSYLAFAPLHTLHRFMNEGSEFTGVSEVGGGEGVDGNDMQALTMESVKDACSLLAVQNSELLRRACLTASTLSREPTPSHLNHTPLTFTQRACSLCTLGSRSRVSELSALLGDLVPLLEESAEQLGWSLNFHKDMLIGTPPIRPVQEEEEEACPDLRPLMDEVHCLDLKTQCLLQRVRDMGVSLTSPDQEAQSPDLLNSQLLAIQTNLKGVSELVEGVATLLTHQEQTIDSSSSRCSSVADSASEVAAVDDEKVPQCQDPNQEDSLSEEEVFEGYVSETDLQNGCGQWEELEEGGVAKAESQEVPLHVLQELKGVLVVRNSEREKRRTCRKGRHKDKHLLTPDQQTINSVVATSFLHKSPDQSRDQSPATPLQHLLAESHELLPTNLTPESPSPSGLDWTAKDSHQEESQNRNHEVSHDYQEKSLDLPEDHTHPRDHTPNHPLATELAAAIKNRGLRKSEDIFS